MDKEIKLNGRKKEGNICVCYVEIVVVACPNNALRFNKSSEDLTFDDEIIIGSKNALSNETNRIQL